MAKTDQNNGEAYGDEFRALLESSFDYKPPVRGEIRNAVILQIEEREVIVDLGAKRDGIVPVQDLERLDPNVRGGLRVGAEVPVYIMNPADQSDNLIVSINMGLQQYDWEKAKQLHGTDEVVETRVKSSNRGGILVQWNRLEGFIPSSHLVSMGSSGGRDTWNELDGKMLTVKVIEVDQSRRRLIFSEREAQREARALQKAKLLSELKEGDVVKGKVTGLRDFGAFVNLGGADGLIHVSELAWHRVDHPRDVLKVGDEIDVYVLSLDRDANRIALSRKRLLDDPWELASDRYHEGQLVEGTVTNVVDFGAFVALDDGLEGLLHLSEMRDGSLKEPHSYVKKSDRLWLRISHLEPEKRRVGFTERWGTDGAEVIAPPTESSANGVHDEAALPEAAAETPATADAAPEAVQSEVPQSEVPQSEVPQSEVPQSEGSQSEMAQSEAPQPETVDVQPETPVAEDSTAAEDKSE